MPAEPEVAAWSRRSARLGSLRHPESGNTAPLVGDHRKDCLRSNQEGTVLAGELDEGRTPFRNVELGNDLAHGELHREVIPIWKTYDCHGPRVPGQGSPGGWRTSARRRRDERRIEFRLQVLDVLDAGADTHQTVTDPERRSLLRAQSAVRRARRMAHRGRDIAE